MDLELTADDPSQQHDDFTQAPARCRRARATTDDTKRQTISWDDVIVLLGQLLDAEGLRGCANGTIRTREGNLPALHDVNTLVTKFLFVHRSHFKLTREYVRDALEGLLQQTARERTELIKRPLLEPPDATGDAPLRQWVRAVTGGEDPVTVAVMGHYVWLVKRTLADLPVERHLMPILFNPSQGIGKSVAVHRLLAPLAELAQIDCKVDMLTDERQRRSLSMYVAGCWDELGGMARADADRIKQTLTAPEVSYRPMGTNSHQTVRNRCRFIGTSNLRIGDIFKDTTGTRRFFEIETANAIDHDLVNRIDYAQLWRCVDHLAAPPIIPHLREVAGVQATQRPKDDVSEWLDHEDWACANNEDLRYDPYVGIDCSVMLNRFTAYSRQHCGLAPDRQIDVRLFKKRLRQEGWLRKQVRGEGGRRPYLYRKDR